MINSFTSAYYDENQYSSIVTSDNCEVTQIDEPNIISRILPKNKYRVLAGRLFIVDPGSPPEGKDKEICI